MAQTFGREIGYALRAMGLGFVAMLALAELISTILVGGTAVAVRTIKGPPTITAPADRRPIDQAL